MTEAIVLAAAVVAGLACPLHMRWSHRRGRQAACCPPERKAEADAELEALRARQERLSALVAQHDAVAAGPAGEAAATDRATR